MRSSRIIAGPTIVSIGTIGSENFRCAPYLVDTGEPPGAPVFADGDDVGAQVVPYERPVCVRPLIIKIKVRHAGHLPRVIYGRPPIC
jgi:hypothetical protein